MVAQLPPDKLDAPGTLLLAAGELAQAMQVFSRAVENNTNARSLCFNGMFLVLIAQELNDDNLRDAADPTAKFAEKP